MRTAENLPCVQAHVKMTMSEFTSAALRISNHNNNWSEEYHQCYPV